MKDRIAELKNQFTERANYFANIDFPITAKNYSDMVEILTEMEAIVHENTALKEENQRLHDVVTMIREEESID